MQDNTVYTGPRIHNLDGVTIKPNQVNPRVLNEKVKGYYSAQQVNKDNHSKKHPPKLEYSPDIYTLSVYDNLTKLHAENFQCFIWSALATDVSSSLL